MTRVCVREREKGRKIDLMAACNHLAKSSIHGVCVCVCFYSRLVWAGWLAGQGDGGRRGRRRGYTCKRIGKCW